MTLASSLVFVLVLVAIVDQVVVYRAGAGPPPRLTSFTDESSLREDIVAYLASRWHGAPSIWDPAPMPANTELRWYDITGTDQNSLWDSMIGAHICSSYSCAPLPDGTKPTEAFALEGDIADQQEFYCYSPRTTTLSWSHFILLPRWSPATDGSTSINTVEAWNALLGVFFTHESRHVAIAEADIAQLNDQAHALPNCAAVVAFWENPHVFDQLEHDQNAYHVQLLNDCRPEIGCVPYGWMGWG